ncbi:hypothetical protein HMPREF3226_01196 [Prevotella corporis]|uniref:Uncharacterized protein n=1 Tax=Prevotella corporis TaxID=28128 RepID=A0A133Q902_9BACT|nr:hypothetical protein HMPREF3226_01196 [Prevotella corporis]
MEEESLVQPCMGLPQIHSKDTIIFFLKKLVVLNLFNIFTVP